MLPPQERAEIAVDAATFIMGVETNGIEPEFPINGELRALGDSDSSRAAFDPVRHGTPSDRRRAANATRQRHRDGHGEASGIVG
ncbi:MAG TPA: hypothetical protein DCQ98_12295 [Planctomycetaceae bacterium]|nr:hypothetical protein [Planctomycetaceae bacterium]